MAKQQYPTGEPAGVHRPGIVRLAGSAGHAGPAGSDEARSSMTVTAEDLPQ